MMPACDQTGTPRHFHSSTTSGPACLMSARTRASVLPRQSSSSLMRASISREGDWPLVVAPFFFMAFDSYTVPAVLGRNKRYWVAGTLRRFLVGVRVLWHRAREDAGA